MVEKIHYEKWAALQKEATDSNLILQEEYEGSGRSRRIYCYTVTSNDLGCTDECETVQDIVDSMEEMRHLLLHGG